MIKKVKTYPDTELGFVQMEFDKKQAKINKVNGVIGLVVTIGMFTLGFLSKELFILMVTTKGLSKIASIFIG